MEVGAYKIRSIFPQSDGTLEWDSTTIIVVELEVDDAKGIGYSYSHESCVAVIRDVLFPIVQGNGFCAGKSVWNDMNIAVRNLGRNGIPSSGIAAVDVALWDLRAKLLGTSFLGLLGAEREEIPVYGSGGFTSYSEKQLKKELGGWVADGISMVKMKVGRDPENDPKRVRWARQAIGLKAKLFVDANGAYSRKQALEKSHQFAELNVSWFEEPVTSDDLAGLRLMRDRAPAQFQIAAGEYNYDATMARRMLEAGAVDVIQIDATRCGGVTGFLQAAALAKAFQIPFSAHTAPALHAHLCCTSRNAAHVEYFQDHVRIEEMFFEGACKPVKGRCRPDLNRPGFGLEFKRRDAQPFRIK
jgi:L-alanine-DL-glutamate epimerase-like enolase superfamily enzyme